MLMDRGDVSAFARTSVPLRTVVSPLTVNSLPLRLRMIGEAPPAPPLPAAAPGAGAAPRPAAAPAAGAAPLGAPPPRAPPPAVIPRRPKSPLHTAAFQDGSNLQALSSFAIPL